MALAVMLLSACSPEGSSGSAADGKDGARSVVDSYVAALNGRDTGRLIEVGGVPDDHRARREAHRILTAKGGRGFSVAAVRIDLDMGPDVGSAKVAMRDRSGKKMNDSFSVVREGGRWHLVVFTDRPTPADKPSSSTERPGGS
ncbi:hypothetical protein ACFVYR_30650 [Streptomyces sp. NPDC058284]|uniref:hypothetical protein n=1 Tax=unclassified Streptomyces TaxID=2593676 RepID=UPI003669F8C9